MTAALATLAMPDSVVPGNLPGGYPAYLGYLDGAFRTAPVLFEQHPQAHVLALTVNGSTPGADGIDCEQGDVNAATAAAWIKRRRGTSSFRPVAYADLETEGYSMAEVLEQLAELGVMRSEVRVHTAHYTEEAHICSPASCGVGFTADATQWTERFPGADGSEIDMSEISASYFGAPPPWVFGPVRGLTAKPGHTNVQLSWSSPAEAEPLAVGYYQIAVQLGGKNVATWPRIDPKRANPEVWSGGSLKPGTEYVALVRAVAADGTHASPWAEVPFTTGR